MKNISIAILLFILPFALSAETDHKAEDHEHEQDHHESQHEHEHGHEEESAGVGLDKGITNKSEDGIKLSLEAEKTFDIKTALVAGATIRIPTKAVVSTGKEKSVYRLRDGWYKRVPVQLISKDRDFAVIKSGNLDSKDRVVISNAGFLRIAEVFSEEGAEHTH